MKEAGKEIIFFLKVMVYDYDRYDIQAYSIIRYESGELSEAFPITVNISEFELPDLKEPGFYTFIGVRKEI